MGDWTFEDTYRARKLKHFRARSLRSPNYRDGDMLQRMVQRGHVWPSWQSDSPLRPDLDVVERHLDRWRRARRGKDQDAAEQAWGDALAAVGAALDRAEELSGRHITSRPL